MTGQQGPPIQCSITLKETPTEKLLFESFPQRIVEGYSVRYQSRSTRSTNATYAYYQGGDYTPFRLNLKFVAGLHRDINATLANVALGEDMMVPTEAVKQGVALDFELQNMETKVRWLEALCFPRPGTPRPSKNKRFVVAGSPPRVLVTYGRFMTIDGQVQNVEVSWGPKFHHESARPFEATVSIGIKRLSTFYLDWYDISQKPMKRSPETQSPSGGVAGIFIGAVEFDDLVPVNAEGLEELSIVEPED